MTSGGPSHGVSPSCFRGSIWIRLAQRFHSLFSFVFPFPGSPTFKNGKTKSSLSFRKLRKINILVCLMIPGFVIVGLEPFGIIKFWLFIFQRKFTPSSFDYPPTSDKYSNAYFGINRLATTSLLFSVYSRTRLQPLKYCWKCFAPLFKKYLKQLFLW